jgi:hypothetical protein
MRSLKYEDNRKNKDTKFSATGRIHSEGVLSEVVGQISMRAPEFSRSSFVSSPHCDSADRDLH